MTSLQERLEEATADLSRCQVASDVAEILRVEGVQGERGRCDTCPVAVLLLRRLGPDIIAISVQIGGGIEVEDINHREAHVEMPRAVAAFVAEFDGDARRPPVWDEFAVTSP